MKRPSGYRDRRSYALADLAWCWMTRRALRVRLGFITGAESSADFLRVLVSATIDAIDAIAAAVAQGTRTNLRRGLRLAGRLLASVPIGQRTPYAPPSGRPMSALGARSRSTGVPGWRRPALT